MPAQARQRGFRERDGSRGGYWFISGGVLLIVAAQFWTSLPAVTAIALIGRGAVLTLQSRPRTPRQDSLILVNLSVYSVLVCLAIVAQSNDVLQSSAAQIRLSMLFDHSAAIVLLAGLIGSVFSRLSETTT